MAKQRKKKEEGPSARPSDLDTLIHERLRLGIVSALAVRDEVPFTELRGALGATDGNLSVQARKLEEAGYIKCIKSFENRRPKTVYRLTATGRQALKTYLETLERLLPSRQAVSNRAVDGDEQTAAMPA
jgi:DNA-binding MarR family transcriptional regulator